MDLAARVISLLESHRAVEGVRLVGSRQRGDAGPLSDWDFEVDTIDFEAVARDLPVVVSPLEPLAQQWDPLSPHADYMLMLRGPMKVDLIFFDQPFQQRPPWKVSPDTLESIDHHFWDWILWLAAKHSAGKHELINEAFVKMSSYLLRPMEAEGVPGSIEAAVDLYTAARRKLEGQLGVVVSDAIEREVRRALRRSGYRV